MFVDWMLMHVKCHLEDQTNGSYNTDMEVTINGKAEMIVKKLVELGRFP